MKADWEVEFVLDLPGRAGIDSGFGRLMALEGAACRTGIGGGIPDAS